MPQRLLAAILATAAVAAAQGSPLPDLSEQRWRERVIVIDAPAREHEAYRTQAAALLPEWAGVRERDIVVISRFDAPAFRLRLVGKDGGVKLDRGIPVSAAELFALVDAMPMRRAEERDRAQTKR